MSVYSTAAKNTMLDALEPDGVELHDGDPGAAGTANRVGGGNGEAAAAFAAASDGARALNADVDFTGLGDSTSITWASVWDDTAFLGKMQLSGDSASNSAGEFTLTTDSELQINDPA